MALLEKTSIGRVVCTQAGLPHVRPARYALIDGTIVFLTSATAALARGQVVAFEIDSIDPESRTGWSVVVVGVHTPVSDPDEIEQIETSLATPWVLIDTSRSYGRIGCDVVTGRRIVAPDPER